MITNSLLTTDEQRTAQKLVKVLSRMHHMSYDKQTTAANQNFSNLNHYHFNVANPSTYLYRSQHNGNGQIVVIRSNQQYLKFQLPINLYTKVDLEHMRAGQYNLTTQTIQSRNIAYDTGVEVYVDGRKVNDSYNYVTVYEGKIDLYIQASFFDTNSSLDVIAKKFSNDAPYINETLRLRNKAARSNITFDGKKTKDDVRVYHDGLLQSEGHDYEIISEVAMGRNIQINFLTSIDLNAEIEVSIDERTIYRGFDSSKANRVIAFHNLLLNKLVLPFEMMGVYHDGRRCFRQDVIYHSSRHYSINPARFNSGGTLDVFVNFNGMHTKEVEEYPEDVVRFLRTYHGNDLVNILVNNTLPESGLNWVLNTPVPPNEIPLPRDVRSTITQTKRQYVDNTIRSGIDTNAHHLIQLLSQFSRENSFTVNYSVWDIIKRERWNSRDAVDGKFGSYMVFNECMILYHFHLVEDNRRIIVMVGNKKLSPDEYYFFDSMSQGFVYIKSSIVFLEKDTVRIFMIPTYNPEQRYIEFSGSGNTFPIERVGQFHQLSDLMVYRRDGQNYTAISATITESNGQVTIAGSFAGTHILHNSSFFHHAVVEATGATISYNTLDLLTNSYLPKMTNYRIIAFRNQEFMAEGIHYNINRQAATITSVSGGFSSGDEIEVYIMEEPINYYGRCTVLNIPEFDVIYFQRTRIFGYSKQYMDLYVNGHYVEPKYIHEVALNMICINQPGIPRPHTSAFVVSRFYKPITAVEYLIQHYRNNESDWAIYLDRVIERGNYTNTIYDVLDKGDFPRAPIENEEEDYDTFMNYVAMNMRSGRVTRRIDANKWHRFWRQYDFVQTMTTEDLERVEMLINANEQQLQRQLLIKPDDSMYSLEQMWKFIQDEISGGRLVFIDNNIGNWRGRIDLADYFQYPISSRLHIEEFGFTIKNSR